MLNEHERHPGVAGKGIEQLSERLEASGRCSDAYYRACLGLRGRAGIARGDPVLGAFLRVGRVAPLSGSDDRIR